MNSSVKLEGMVGVDSEKRLYFDTNSLFYSLLIENEMQLFYRLHCSKIMEPRMLPKLTYITSSDDEKPLQYLLQGNTKEFLTFFGNNLPEYEKAIITGIDDFDLDIPSRILQGFENTSNSGYFKKINYREIKTRRYNNGGILVHSSDITQDQLDKIFPKGFESKKPFYDNEYSIPDSAISSKILKIRHYSFLESEINVLRKRLSERKQFLDLLLISE